MKVLIRGEVNSLSWSFLINKKHKGVDEEFKIHHIKRNFIEKWHISMQAGKEHNLKSKMRDGQKKNTINCSINLSP